jgi:probable HAF family extracellular repeat protein
MRIWSNALAYGLAVVAMSAHPGADGATSEIGQPAPGAKTQFTCSAPGHCYRVQKVCDNCAAHAMNASGQVTGQIAYDFSTPFPAFFWDPVTEELLIIGGYLANGLAINGKGQVAGNSRSDSVRLINHAFFWDPSIGVMEDLGTLGGDSTYAADINEQGQITGTSQTVASDTAFLWDPITREMRDLGSLINEDGIEHSEGMAISDSGYATGVFITARPDAPRASKVFVWSPMTQQIVRIPTFSGSVESTGAVDINNAGQVVGGAGDSTGASQAFRWNMASNSVDFPGTLGGDQTTPVAMNEVGQITGVAYVVGTTPTVPTVSHAFFWDATKSRIRDLGVLGYPSHKFAAQYSEGLGINNVGEITGTSTTASEGFKHAFLWDGLELRDLNALISPNDPLIGSVTLERGVAINDAGRILAIGQDPRTGAPSSYLLTPLPTVPFARFRPITNIDLRPVQGKDWFDTFASFTLGVDTNGIAPLKEPVTIQIGTFSTTIPARAFKLINGDFVFKGRIDGVKLYARFHQIKGRNYEFWTYANCASLIGTSNPVRVGLVIGDDSGTATITAKFGSKVN